MSDGPDICWFRRDLRVADQPALVGDGHTPTVSVFVVDPRPLATAGPRRRALLARHLTALDARLRDAGGDLLVLEGD
ncbi:MAG: deoxyribodipyrimidine photo-lyase, partial [Acidobacteria bacterium]|nr:deoxyribodipyrimidine photo-lyase [Acidobacteriota bacterium]